MKRETKAIAAVGLALVLILIVLAGCGGQATPTPADEFEAYTSTYLDASFEGALPASSQLALGILLLEETEQAVSLEQAASLLPLWQSLQSGTLQGSAEVNAVLAAIEKALEPEQLEAIAAMQITWEDMRAWAESQGLSMGLGEGYPGPGSGPGGREGLGGSPELRETMRAEMESLSPEEQAARREEFMATAEAGGMTMPGPEGGGRAGAGRGQFTILLDPLIELLTARAGES